MVWRSWNTSCRHWKKNVHDWGMGSKQWYTTTCWCFNAKSWDHWGWNQGMSCIPHPETNCLDISCGWDQLYICSQNIIWNWCSPSYFWSQKIGNPSCHLQCEIQESSEIRCPSCNKALVKPNTVLFGSSLPGALLGNPRTCWWLDAGGWSLKTGGKNW